MTGETSAPDCDLFGNLLNGGKVKPSDGTRIDFNLKTIQTLSEQVVNLIQALSDMHDTPLAGFTLLKSYCEMAHKFHMMMLEQACLIEQKLDNIDAKASSRKTRLSPYLVQKGGG